MLCSRANVDLPLITQNTTENKCYLIGTKRDCFSAEVIFNWFASVTGRQQAMVDFSQRKSLSRSTANSTVTIFIFGSMRHDMSGDLNLH